MITCIGCACGFGLPGHVYEAPLRRGKATICPSCDAVEKERGYLHPSNYTFRVWHKDKFEDVHLLSYQGIAKAVNAMRNMTVKQRREYLLKLAKEKKEWVL